MKGRRILFVVASKLKEGERFSGPGKPWFPPTAPLYIGALTDRRHEFILWDEFTGGPLPREMLSGVDLCAVSSLTPSRYGAERIARMCREEKVIVAGGGVDVTGRFLDGETEALLATYDTIMPFHTTREGWSSLVEDCVGSSLKPIYQSPPETPLESVMYRYDLINLKRYFCAPLPSSHGCIYDCDFCIVPAMYGKHKVHYIDPAIDRQSLEYLGSHGIRFCGDICDSFGIDYSHAMEILEGRKVAYKKYGMIWFTEGSAPFFVGNDKRPEIVTSMWEAGCVLIYFGLETLRKNMGKNKPKDVERLFKLCRETGILTLASNILDFLEDATWEDVEETVSFLTKNRVAAQYSEASPNPGTPCRHELIEQGYKLDEDARLYDGSFPLVPSPPHQVSQAERRPWLRGAYKTHYTLANLAKILLMVISWIPRDPHRYILMLRLVWEAWRSVRSSVHKWDKKGWFNVKP